MRSFTQFSVHIAQLAATGLLIICMADSQATELQATRNQTLGCFFGNNAEGTLGASTDLRTLSTEYAGGERPRLQINVIGSATLSLVPKITWVFNLSEIPNVTSLLTLRTDTRAGETVPLPQTFNSNGLRNFYLEIQGVRSEGFFEQGDYKVLATFNCI